MATSNKGPARDLPAHGTDGQIPVVDTSSTGSPQDLKWGAATNVAYTPADNTKWGTHIPTTIGGALDIIASMITIT